MGRTSSSTPDYQSGLTRRPRAAHARAAIVNGAVGRRARQSSLSSVSRPGSRPAVKAPAGPTPSVNRSHQSSKVGCSTATVSAVSSISLRPAASNSSRRCPSRAPARPDSSSTSGSRTRAASQNSASGLWRPAWSQTQAATTPPGRVTRRHLREPGDGVRHEVDDELRDRGVERVVRKRKVLGRRLFHRDAGEALARRLDERLRRIDGGDRVRADAPDQLGRERTRAAADVEDALPVRDAREVRELRGELDGVDAHKAVIRLGRHREAHLEEIYAGSGEDGEMRVVRSTARRGGGIGRLTGSRSGASTARTRERTSTGLRPSCVTASRAARR